MCPNRPVALDPALLFPMRHGSTNVHKVEEQAQIKREQAATITDLKSALAQQQKDIAALATALKAQAAQIQKVSDQLRTEAVAPRLVANK